MTEGQVTAPSRTRWCAILATMAWPWSPTQATAMCPARTSPLFARESSNQTWGRAFSVVGGTNITYRNVYAERSSAAAIYIAAEANWHTYPVSNILADGATINYANQTAAVDHGAVMFLQR